MLLLEPCPAVIDNLCCVLHGLVLLRSFSEILYNPYAIEIVADDLHEKCPCFVFF